MSLIYNQAELSYEGTTVHSNIVSSELLDALSAEKAVIKTEYARDDKLTFIITLKNKTFKDIDHISITENLGAYYFSGLSGLASITVYPLTYVENTLLYYKNGSLQSTPSFSGTAPMNIEDISVPAGGDATIIYEASTNSWTPLKVGSSVNNMSKISCTSVSEPILLSATAIPLSKVELFITKTASPDIVMQTGKITYSFLIENRGNIEAKDTVVISDKFNPIIDDLYVTINKTHVTGAEYYSYDTTTGIFTTTGKDITVPPATYTTDSATGKIKLTPGTVLVRVTGTL